MYNIKQTFILRLNQTNTHNKTTI